MRRAMGRECGAARPSPGRWRGPEREKQRQAPISSTHALYLPSLAPLPFAPLSLSLCLSFSLAQCVRKRQQTRARGLGGERERGSALQRAKKASREKESFFFFFLLSFACRAGVSVCGRSGRCPPPPTVSSPSPSFSYFFTHTKTSRQPRGTRRFNNLEYTERAGPIPSQAHTHTQIQYKNNPFTPPHLAAAPAARPPAPAGARPPTPAPLPPPRAPARRCPPRTRSRRSG